LYPAVDILIELLLRRTLVLLGSDGAFTEANVDGDNTVNGKKKIKEQINDYNRSFTVILKPGTKSSLHFSIPYL